MTFQAMLLFLLRALVPVKYPTLASFLDAYPNFCASKGYPESELQKLHAVANWLDLVLFTLKPRNHKTFLLNLVPRLCEGRSAKYCTGSGETRATSDRVLIYRQEGNCEKVVRPPRKRKKRADEFHEVTDDVRDVNSHIQMRLQMPLSFQLPVGAPMVPMPPYGNMNDYLSNSMNLSTHVHGMEYPMEAHIMPHLSMQLPQIPYMSPQSFQQPQGLPHGDKSTGPVGGLDSKSAPASDSTRESKADSTSDHSSDGGANSKQPGGLDLLGNLADIILKKDHTVSSNSGSSGEHVGSSKAVSLINPHVIKVEPSLVTVNGNTETSPSSSMAPTETLAQVNAPVHVSKFLPDQSHSGMGLADMGPFGMGPAGMGLAGMGPAGMDAFGMDPAGFPMPYGHTLAEGFGYSPMSMPQPLESYPQPLALHPPLPEMRVPMGIPITNKRMKSPEKNVPVAASVTNTNIGQAEVNSSRGTPSLPTSSSIVSIHDDKSDVANIASLVV